MPRAEQFQRVEDEYYRLKGKYATGRLTEEEFDQALKDLVFQDSQAATGLSAPIPTSGMRATAEPG